MGKISDALGKAMGKSPMDEDVEPDLGDPMEESEGEDDGASLMAAKQLIKAVNAGSAEKVRSALKAFLESS
jgi:hypothetical protein